jgi:ATP-binding cassette, subfamily B, bacterial
MKKVTLRELFNKYKWFLIAITVFSLIGNSLNLFIPRLIGQTIDKTISSSSQAIDSSFIVISLSVVLLGLFFSLLEVGFGAWFSEKFGKDIRILTFSNLSKQPYQYVIKEGTANIITVFNSDIENVQQNFTSSLSYIFQAIFLLIGSLILMFITSWKLALVAVLAFPIIVIAFAIIFKTIGTLFQKAQENLTDLNSRIGENINASTLIRVLSSFDQEKNKYLKSVTESKNISINIVKSFSLLLPLILIISNIVTLIFLYYGGRLVSGNELSIGNITAFISYFQLLIAPIFILGFTSQGISQALTSWNRIEKILNADFQIKDGDYKTDKLKGDIEVKNLYLEYEGKKVLDNVSFKIKSGQKTAIIGPTGAGKSQLLSILVGLNQPTNGEVIIDGINIQNWNKASLLQNIGIVFQESLIFNTSFYQNIILDREVSDNKLQMAINTVQLREYVNQSNFDQNRIMDEKGANLSGGQKQRVTLARAIVTSPQIVLLDDFTARVDNDTEKKIRSALEQNYPKTQIIQVCQKIDSIKDYDNIIVLMEGQLLGQGKHEELLIKCHEYKQIYESQQTVV